MTRDPQRAIDAVWRIESAKIIGGVARLVRDVGLAEELAQDALVAALEHWPADGIPANPGAWLMATAKNRALDHLRQQALHLRKQQELGADADARGDHVVPDFSDALDDTDDIGDDLLRLMFTACHPVLAQEAQVALTLRLLGGLSTSEIARAFVATRADRRAAHRARQAHAQRRTRAVRGPARRCAGRAAGGGAGGHLPDLQRRLLGHRAARTGCGPRCATRRCAWAACWPS